MAEAPLFDAYLMVDWSAAAEPRRGKDSIWLYHRRRGAASVAENPRTRHEARARLLALLEANLAARLRTLAGFDFPFGYPAGFARRLGLGDPPWRAVWRYLAAYIEDDDKNHNNRFEVAAEINQGISNGPAPFWGHPPGKHREFVESKKHWRDDLGFEERRIIERELKTAQPVWKLCYPGSVGSQALTGIPVVEALYVHFSAKGALVWPFDTGLAPPPRGTGEVVFAEIYPSLFEVQRRDNEVLDAAQVRTTAENFEAADACGALAELFLGDPTLSAAERARVEREEGWILGAQRRG